MSSGSRRVLVTGGAGFIGSHVCDSLASDGIHVVALDHLAGAHASNLTGLVSGRKLTLVDGSIGNAEVVDRAAEGCETIYHLAATPGSRDHPRSDFETNVTGTVNVLEAARRLDCPVVYSSSNKVYGDAPNRVRLREEKTRLVLDDPEFIHGIPETLPIDEAKHDIYGLTKVIADLAVQDYANIYGLRTGVFRQSCIYGPRVLRGWVGFLTHGTIQGKPVTVNGNGKQLRDMLYVTDLVAAYRRFVDGRLQSGVWNIGGGPEHTLSVVELLELVERFSGNPSRAEYRLTADMGQRFFVTDIRRIATDLGWKPTVGPAEGMRRTVDWAKNLLTVQR